MSNSAKILCQLITEARRKEIDDWIAKYPAEQKQSAVMRALMLVQEEHGYLTAQLMDAVADYLDMAPIAVYEVASFYSMYEHKPVGRHVIGVCNSISCYLRGSTDIVKRLEKSLDITCGGTTADRRFTLRTVECLGACVGAPMMHVDKDYHENLTTQSAVDVLDQYE